MTKGNKKTPVSQPQKVSKVPAILRDDVDHGKRHLVFNFQILDLMAPFTTDVGMTPQGMPKLMDALKAFSGLTWGVVDQKRKHHHFLTRTSLAKIAVDRLKVLGLEDHHNQEEIFSLRLDGTWRLYSVRTDDVLFVLWWDENHLICPSTLKNT